MKTLELDSTYIPALDLLAHAYGALDNWEKWFQTALFT